MANDQPRRRLPSRREALKIIGKAFGGLTTFQAGAEIAAGAAAAATAATLGGVVKTQATDYSKGVPTDEEISTSAMEEANDAAAESENSLSQEDKAEIYSRSVKRQEREIASWQRRARQEMLERVPGHAAVAALLGAGTMAAVNMVAAARKEDDTPESGRGK